MKQSITIAVACYNEEDSIILTIKTLLSALSKGNLLWEIIIMDDASTDSSVDKIKTFINDNAHLPLHLHINPLNKGLEWNVFKAASLGKNKYFWVVAGDNALSEQTYLELLSHVGKADIIIPHVLFYHGKTLIRSIISKSYVFIVNFLSKKNIKYYNGSSVYLRTDLIKYMDSIKGFSYSAELILLLLEEGKNYIEVPVIFNDRRAGKSKAINLKNLMAVCSFFVRLIQRRFSPLAKTESSAIKS